MTDVSLELFKVDTAKRNTCDSKIINPNHLSLTKQSVPVTSAHVPTNAFPINLTATAMPYTEDFCVRELAVEEHSIEKIKMFPNPAIQQISFTGVDALDVTIMDASGKIVSQQYLNNERQMDVSELAAGLYFVEISNGKNTTTFKLIKE